MHEPSAAPEPTAAPAGAGKLLRQAQLFSCAEAITLLLNWGIFQLLLAHLPPPVPPELVGFLGTFLVFIGFAYPVRRYVVFRLPRSRESLATGDTSPPRLVAGASPVLRSRHGVDRVD